MDACTPAEKSAVVRELFRFAISHRVRDEKGTGESDPRGKRNIIIIVRKHINIILKDGDVPVCYM